MWQTGDAPCTEHIVLRKQITAAAGADMRIKKMGEPIIYFLQRLHI